MPWRCDGCTRCLSDGGCVEEICGGCFCSKEREQNVCSECHAYNLDHEPYLLKYGPDNKRSYMPTDPAQPLSK